MTKIPKRLMRDFAAITGLQEIMKTGVLTKNSRQYILDDWQDVIELAAEWCKKREVCFNIDCCVIGWAVDVGKNIHLHNNLPRAIMEAVVAAAKEG
jgi:hypothetical protein